MNKNLIMMMAAAAMTLSACSDDEPKGGQITFEDHDVKLTIENLDNWTKYAHQVAVLLAKDAENLLKSWKQSYEGGPAFADIFKHHSGNGYTSAASCIEEIIDGCADIANEVGEAKMGDPYDLLAEGKTLQALYAVESWYSWHSREDYSNNILSVRNSYYGSLDGTVSPASISALTAKVNPVLDAEVKEKIALAYNAILAIPDPFRNNINSPQTRSAMAACENLEKVLDNRLKPMFETLAGHDGEEQLIVENYVDNVVLPTYVDLKNKTAALLGAVKTLMNDPTGANFEAACGAWLAARAPWELSEAFLFGPVDALGLDPNMDSWPLDQTAIVSHIAHGDFSDLEWSEGDSGDRVESAQNIRGFHTLEFLLFNNGKPRELENR